MPSTLARAIRKARLATGLNQEALGRRIGLQGRTLSRWECDTSTPSKAHRRALVTAVHVLDQNAAAALAAVFASDAKESPGAPVPAPAPAAPAPVPAAPAPAPVAPAASPKVALELAVFAMADELDLPPRRVRNSLARLVKRWRETNLTLEAAQRELEQWIESTTS
jgi:transcriptional regulator with XRE-family HTH domain